MAEDQRTTIGPNLKINKSCMQAHDITVTHSPQSICTKFTSSWNNFN